MNILSDAANFKDTIPGSGGYEYKDTALGILNCNGGLFTPRKLKSSTIADAFR